MLPPGSGLYSQVHRAWEDYCLQMGLPIILVEGTDNPGSDDGASCTRIHVYTSPFQFYKPTVKLGVCHSVLEGLSSWEETCQRAIDTFSFDHPRVGCDPTGVTFINEHWTTFDNFPSASVEALAMFLERRARENRAHPLEEEKQIRKEVRRWSQRRRREAGVLVAAIPPIWGEGGVDERLCRHEAKRRFLHAARYAGLRLVLEPRPCSRRGTQ